MQTASSGWRTCSRPVSRGHVCRALGMAAGKLVLRRLPSSSPWFQRLRRAIDDRFFGVFQVTRVTNDNYDSSTREVPAALEENG